VSERFRHQDNTGCQSCCHGRGSLLRMSELVDWCGWITYRPEKQSRCHCSANWWAIGCWGKSHEHRRPSSKDSAPKARMPRPASPPPLRVLLQHFTYIASPSYWRLVDFRPIFCEEHKVMEKRCFRYIKQQFLLLSLFSNLMYINQPTSRAYVKRISRSIHPKVSIGATQVLRPSTRSIAV
jgi:hypothetical protein